MPVCAGERRQKVRYGEDQPSTQVLFYFGEKSKP